MARPQTPSLTVDIIIELNDQTGSSVILIERKFPPYGWALPGGFVDIGETVENAARREAKEEVSLDVHLEKLLGCYSDPSRDNRGHSVSLVYIASASGHPVAADDASEVGVFRLDELPKKLAFDHGEILEDYRRFKQSGDLPAL